MVNFSFIIPTFDKYELVERCVASIKKFETDNNYEIIVVQDGGTTRIAEQIKIFCEKNNAKFFFKDNNEGFAKAVNYGIDKSGGKYIVLVNNDVTFTQKITNTLSETFNLHPRIGIVGGLLYFPDGRIQHGGMIRQGKIFAHRTNQHAHASQYLIAVTGALLAIRRETIQTIGKLDESYFISCEDTDYCLRAWRAGWRVYYAAKMSAVHLEGATRGNTPDSKTIKGKHWKSAEETAQKKFYSELNVHDLSALDSSVIAANQEMRGTGVSFSVPSEDQKTYGIIRAGALGDIIMATGLIRKFHADHPNSKIYVSTRIPDVFVHVPYVKVFPYSEPFKDPFSSEVIRINLDLAYEKTPKRHIISSYADVFFKDPNIFEMPELISIPADYISFGHKMISNKLGQGIPKNSIVVHMGNNWPNRTWPINNWRDVVNHFSRDFTIFIVGKGQDFSFPGKNVVNLLNKLSILEIRELIKRTRLFIGMDSGLLYVAQTTLTPNVGLFTCANPDYRIFRKETTIALIPDVPCRFCLHEEPPPTCYVGCKYNHFQCLKDITPRRVVEAAQRLGV